MSTSIHFFARRDLNIILGDTIIYMFYQENTVTHSYITNFNPQSLCIVDTISPMPLENSAFPFVVPACKFDCLFVFFCTVDQLNTFVRFGYIL